MIIIIMAMSKGTSVEIIPKRFTMATYTIWKR